LFTLKFQEMIQRIQSLYLLLTTLLSLIFLKGSFLSFINEAGSVINISLNGITRGSEGQGSELIQTVLPITILIPLIAILSFGAIFCFKKRNIQLMMSKILIALVIALILVSGYYSYIIISKFNGEIVPGVKMALPFIILVLSILAFRGIRKDDKLVKSYDRLR
jgi:uncharacterized paraquat-inducible protein A